MMKFPANAFNENNVWARIFFLIGFLASALLQGCSATSTDTVETPLTQTDELLLTEPDIGSDMNSETEVVVSNVVWRGNDTLGNPNWKQDWGLIGWNEEAGILMNGFWGYDDVDVVEDPYDSEHKVIRVLYLQDTNTTESGVGMLFQPELNLASNKQACLSYDILFDHDFEFGTVGGKIPGLHGFNYESGQTPDATYCAGPYEYDSSICFSSRYSYRNISSIAQYESQMYYEIIPWMDEQECRDAWNCDLPYGEGMVMNAPQPELTEAKKSEWTNIRQEIKLNDEGESNGYIRVWYENNLIYSEENLTITQGGNVPINGILMHALFGHGTDLSQGSPTTQYSYFADFEIANSCDALD